MIDTTILYILLVVFLATLIQSTFGFGQAIIAVPLLALMIPLQIATPLVALLSIAIGAVVVTQDWREVHLSSVVWLLVPTFVGIPLGIALLASSHPHLVKALLAIVIVGFSGNALVGKKPPALASDSRPWLLGCGFFAGVLGGAYGMNGPPVVMYGAMRGWSPQHFRATLQGYFLILEPRRPGGILVRGTLGCGGHPRFPDFSVVRGPGYLPGQSYKPAPAGPRLSEVCVRRPGSHWRAFANPGNSRGVSMVARTYKTGPRCSGSGAVCCSGGLRPPPSIGDRRYKMPNCTTTAAPIPLTASPSCLTM